LPNPLNIRISDIQRAIISGRFVFCICKVYTITGDVFFLYRGQTFVWDGQKAIENRAKHAVGFETACEAFFDDLSVYVDATVVEERRTAVIGLSKAIGLLYVVHVEREADEVRIISARVATKRERKTYEDG